MDENMNHFNFVVIMVENCTNQIFDWFDPEIDIDNSELWTVIRTRLYIFALEVLTKKC